MANDMSAPATPPAATKRKLPNPWVLMGVGVAVAVVAFFMLRSGNDHKDSYDAFENCKQSSQTVCVLYNDGSQASSASEFKDNYENQLRIGKIGIGIGALLVIAGAGVLTFRRTDG